MQSIVVKDANSYLEGFGILKGELSDGGLTWLRPVREKAIESFMELGFPTARHEEWRFTNLSPITRTAFRLAEGPETMPDRSLVERFGIPGLGAPRLVFVDGRYMPGLSEPGGLPATVSVGSIREAAAGDTEELEGHLARYADFDTDAFSALNTAFMLDGMYILVPKGVVVDAPVHVLNISTGGQEPVITNPRNLIVAGESSQLTVVEDYVSAGPGVHFSNVVTEVVAGENSTVHHYMLERESKDAYNISTLRIELARASYVSSHSLLLGGALVRNNVHPVLAGEGAECMLNGLFLGADTQHLDNFMRVEHASPHCASRQFYYGILDDSAHAVFSGRIIVHKDAQKTDAKQTNRNLLLSENAVIDSKPQLEIYADDVKCTHGATIGQLSEDALFYLRSRSIPLAQARRMLLLAFAGECTEKMESEPVKDFVGKLISEWFASRFGFNTP